MLMSNEQYVAEEYEKVSHYPHMKDIDSVYLLDADGSLTCKRFCVGVAALNNNMLYELVDQDETAFETIEGVCLRRTAFSDSEIEAIKQEASRYVLRVFYERNYSGHEAGIFEGGDSTPFDIDDAMIVVENGSFKGMFLNWIGCAEGSWWNGINQCVLFADGNVFGCVSAVYGFDYDDSAYYGKDGWGIRLELK